MISVVIIICIIFLLSTTPGIMKIRGHNYRGKEQGVTHNQPTGESTHTSRKEQDSLFSWISKSLQRVGKETLTKETLTLVRKDTNTNSFPKWSLTKHFLEKTSLVSYVFCTYFSSTFTFLDYFQSIFSTSWSEEREKKLYVQSHWIFFSVEFIFVIWAQ